MINAPESFSEELELMSGEAKIIRSVAEINAIDFVMVFVTKRKEIEDPICKVSKKLSPDPVKKCIRNPKGTSKKYTCEFNRDNGWKSLGEHDLEPVRIVAIDEDWSALRFRKTDFIKTLSRTEVFSLSAKGQARSAEAGKK